MNAITSKGFEALVGEAFLINLYRRTNCIYGNSQRAKFVANETESQLAFLGILGFIRTTASRISGDLANETRSIFNPMIYRLRDSLTAIIFNAKLAEISWTNKNFDIVRRDVDDLTTASRMARNSVLEVGSQIISNQLEGCKDLSKIGDSKIGDIIQIALNLSDPRRIGIPDVNVLTPVTISQQNSELLIRILLNVVKNAYDAMSQKVYGDESASLKIFTDVQNGNLLDIEVKDNGIGMSPEILEKVFTPHFTTKKNIDDKGVGLSVCREMVKERFGGELLIDSTLGKGTIVHIKMPLAQ